MTRTSHWAAPGSYLAITTALVLGYASLLLPSGPAGKVATEILLLFAVVGGVAVASDQRKHLRVSLALGVLLFGFRSWAYWVPAEPAAVAGLLGFAFFFHTAGLHYDLYRTTFPLWALGLYARRRAEV